MTSHRRRTRLSYGTRVRPIRSSISLKLPIRMFDHIQRAAADCGVSGEILIKIWVADKILARQKKLGAIASR
jgi:hypothetical protein